MTVQKNNSEGATPLPCLYSHISTENHNNVNTKDVQGNDIVFTTGRKRSAFILAQSVEKLARLYGLTHLGFLTLTFADHVLCAKEAQKRLNSLFSHVIKPRYGEYVGVFERQKSGRIHYHLLVRLAEDVRTGVDFGALLKGDYRTAGAYLRGEWKYWRDTARKYRFGRTELMPIKSSSEAIKYYVGKYIGKSISASVDGQDKHVRLVRYSKGARAGNTRFSFLSTGTSKWREAVQFFSELLEEHYGVPIRNTDDISARLGNRWAYKYRQYILGISEAIEAFEPIKSMIKGDFKENLKPQFNVALAIKCISSQ